MKNEKTIEIHVLRAVTTYKQLLDNHLCIGDPAAKLSLQFGVSRNVLQLGFKQLYGEGIREYKLRKRMERSRNLLDLGKDVKEVAQELKYTEARAFTTAFKKFYGYTPSVFCKLMG